MFMFRQSVLVLLMISVMFMVFACSSDPEPVGPPLEGEVEDLASEFISKLLAKDYSGAVTYFNAEMKKAMSESKLKQTWEGLLIQMGSYEGELEKRVESSEDYEAVNVLSQFANDQINIRVVFDSDNRVAGLWFQNVE